MKNKGNYSAKQIISIFSTISYFLFSVYLIFYFVFSLTVLKLQIFPTIFRITYFDRFANWSITDAINYDIFIAFLFLCIPLFFIFQKRVAITLTSFFLGISIFTTINSFMIESLEIIFLLSLPIVCVLFFQNFWKKGFQIVNYRIISWLKSSEKLVCVFSTIIVGLLAYNVVTWLILPAFNEISTNPWTWKINDLESTMFYSISRISIFAMVFSILSFFVRPIFQLLIMPIFEGVNKKSDLNTLEMKSECIIEQDHSKFWPIIFLAIASTIFLPLYSYSNVLSEDTVFLGTDVPLYLEWLSPISNSTNIQDALFYQPFFEIHDGSRPFTLLSIHFISQFGPTYDEVLKFLPVILGPALVLSIYYLTRTLYPQSKKIAVIASLLTAVSHQIVIGFYAAFYANWLGLIVLFLGLAFLIKSTNDSRINIKHIGLFGICLTSSLLIHSYSWSYFIAVIFLYLIWTFAIYKKEGKNLKIIVILLLIVIGVVGLDIIKTFGGSSDSFTKDLDFAESALGISEFGKRWNNLGSVFTFYLGGYLSNFILIGFLLIWTLRASYSNNSDRLFFSMLFVSILPVFIGDFVVQSRIFYNIPFQIPASLIIYKIIQSRKLVFGKTLAVILILIMFSYALRAMANMELIPENI